jgi:SAM-dependent methyltransferase
VGLDVWGLDWDVRAVEFGQRCRGLEHLYAQSIEEFQAAERGDEFDAVTIFEVLEHQDEPAAFLHRVAALLKPGGVLTGSVPNRTRFIIGGREEWDYPPQHLLWFHRHSLMSLLQRSGFERIRIYSLLDMRALTNQILARFSFGLASRVVQMPEAPASNVTELSAGEWEQLKTRSRPFGYRVTTITKKIMLAPVLVPALLWGKAIPSVRHTLYFEAHRAKGSV